MTETRPANLSIRGGVDVGAVFREVEFLADERLALAIYVLAVDADFDFAHRRANRLVGAFDFEAGRKLAADAVAPNSSARTGKNLIETSN